MSVMPTSSTKPPGVDELEVSLFGPGKGESVVVHLGGGQWIVVDSCVDQRSGQNPALFYLESMGVDVANSVVLVVATHAHDDHFKGIATIYDACKSSNFVCGAAVSASEFRALIDLEPVTRPAGSASAYREYRRVFEIASSRRGANPGGVSPVKRAMEGRTLFDRAADSGLPAAKVLALSPSDVAHERSLRAIGSVLPTEGSTRHLSVIDPNELTVALWVTVGESYVLLGGDLTNGPSGCGWEAVLATFAPAARAQVFKVAHHGSPNAHHDGVWRQLLGDDPIAMLTPFRGSPTPRPADEDVARIRSLTRFGFATARTRPPTPSTRMKKARAQLGGVARDVRDPWGRVGHIRARARADSSAFDVDVDTPAYAFGSA